MLLLNVTINSSGFFIEIVGEPHVSFWKESLQCLQEY